MISLFTYFYAWKLRKLDLELQSNKT